MGIVPIIVFLIIVIIIIIIITIIVFFMFMMMIMMMMMMRMMRMMRILKFHHGSPPIVVGVFFSVTLCRIPENHAAKLPCNDSCPTLAVPNLQVLRLKNVLKQSPVFQSVNHVLMNESKQHVTLLIKHWKHPPAYLDDFSHCFPPFTEDLLISPCRRGHVETAAAARWAAAPCRDVPPESRNAGGSERVPGAPDLAARCITDEDIIKISIWCNMV